MLWIETAAQENGAHRNQRSDAGLPVLPEGWLPVAPELEEEAWGYLPFIQITEITDGEITGVAQGPIPEPGPEPELPPTLAERVESLETEKADKTAVEELDEALHMILEGETE